MVSTRCMKFKNVLYRLYLIENLINIFFFQNKDVLSGNGVCFESLTFYTRFCSFFQNFEKTDQYPRKNLNQIKSDSDMYAW